MTTRTQLGTYVCIREIVEYTTTLQVDDMGLLYKNDDDGMIWYELYDIKTKQLIIELNAYGVNHHLESIASIRLKKIDRLLHSRPDGY